MWLGRSIVFGFVSVGLFALAVWLAPPQWYRQSGILDFVLVLDNSGSYEEALPVAVKEAPRLVEKVLPGDRFAAFAVGPRVLPLFNGVVDSQPALALVSRQVRALQVNTNGGTELAAVLVEVRKAFESFAVSPGTHGRRRRLLVMFSDCLDTSADPRALAASASVLPARTSVLVVGLQGSDKDAVTRALLGTERNNDLHVVPPAEAPQATRGLLEDMTECHPLKLAMVVLAALACAVAGAGAAWSVGAVAASASRPLVVSLRQRGDEDTAQEFPLSDGDSLVVGGGDVASDFRVPVSGHCTLARVGRELAVTPGIGRLVVRRRGIELPISDPVAVCDRDSLVLESREVEVSLR